MRRMADRTRLAARQSSGMAVMAALRVPAVKTQQGCQAPCNNGRPMLSRELLCEEPTCASTGRGLCQGLEPIGKPPQGGVLIGAAGAIEIKDQLSGA